MGQGLPPTSLARSAMKVKWKSLVVVLILLVESRFADGTNRTQPLYRSPEYRRYWLPGVGEQMPALLLLELSRCRVDKNSKQNTKTRLDARLHEGVGFHV